MCRVLGHTSAASCSCLTLIQVLANTYALLAGNLEFLLYIRGRPASSLAGKGKNGGVDGGKRQMFVTCRDYVAISVCYKWKEIIIRCNLMPRVQSYLFCVRAYHNVTVSACLLLLPFLCFDLP